MSDVEHPNGGLKNLFIFFFFLFLPFLKNFFTPFFFFFFLAKVRSKELKISSILGACKLKF